MLILLKMALKNIRRYRLRSAITISAVAVSVAVSILMDAFIGGITEQSIINLLDFESSEIMIYSNGYHEKADEYPTDILIENKQKERILSTLEQNGIACAPRFRSPAELVCFDEERGLDAYTSSILVAVDAKRDPEVYGISGSITSGSWWKEEMEGIVIGSSLADKMGLETGSYITLSCKSRWGFLETFDEQIVGIINTGNPVVNSSMVFIPLHTVDEMLSLNGAVSEISISDSSPSVAGDSFFKRISTLLEKENGVETRTWQQNNEDLVAMMNGKKGSSYLMLIFLFIIAGAGITNTMLMAVMERKKENAMLRAMGFSKRKVSLLFVMEGFLIGIIGSIIGIAVGLILNYPLAKYGFDMTSMLPDNIDIGYRVSLVLRSAWQPKSFISIPCAAVLLASLSALLPALKAAKEEIAAVLRRS